MSPSEPGSGTSSDSSVTFTADIRPLLRDKDRNSVRRAFGLWSYEDVVTHASAIASKLHDGAMPCGGPRPAEQVSAFDRWVGEGTPQ